MEYSELLHCLCLKNTAGIGNILANRLLYHFKSAKNIFEAKDSDFEKISGIGINHIKNIRNSYTKINNYASEIDYILENSIQANTIFNTNYSKLLAEIPDSPITYFSKGNFNLNEKINISIVGTRKMTSYGKQIIEEIIEFLSQYNINIISGLAYGVDIAAHKFCIEKGVPTVAVLAHGFKHLYPASHKKYLKSIMENGGIITEYTSETLPIKENFLQRNRIIAGLSPVTIVIESAFGGGAITTANYAFNYDREIFAVPGKTTDIYSQGCNRLISQNKAQIFNRPEDLIDIIGLNKTIHSQIQSKLFLDLNENEEKIVSILKENKRMQIDSLSNTLEKPTYQLMNILLELEFKGIIRPLAGKYFELI